VRLEEEVQLVQGKGWGTSTVAAEVAAVRRLLGPSADGPLTVLDVGANAGAWTREALRQLPAAHVHSFEPASAARAHLSSEFGSNARVSIHPIALGATDSEATLYADAPGSGLASLSQRRLDHRALSLTHEERVTVRTLPSWLTYTGVDKVDVLKLDVEGHELDVLRAATDQLKTVRVIQFEFGGCNIDTRTYWQDFWYLLSDAGYRLYRLAPRRLIQVSRYHERDESFLTTNFFAQK